MQFCVVQYSIPLYYTVQYCSVLCSTVLHCTLLYCKGRVNKKVYKFGWQFFKDFFVKELITGGPKGLPKPSTGAWMRGPVVTWNSSLIIYTRVQYNSVQCNTVQYRKVQVSAVHYSEVQYSIVQYSTVQYSTVQYSNWLPWSWCLELWGH